MKKTLITLIALASLANADFTRNSSIVIDSVTSLQWQDDTSPYAMTWQNAISHCENLSLGGYGDWRLPNINELESIVERTKTNPAIVNGFVNTSSKYYWSSTTLTDYSHNAWIVNFNYGYENYRPKDSSLYVRCVRAGK